MRLTMRMEMMWWGGAALVLALVLWRLGDVMVPFLLGAGLAYLLDPLASWLVRRGLSRTLAVGLITLLAVMVVGIGLVVLVPLLIRQVAQFLAAVPGYIEVLQGWAAARFPDLVPDEGLLARRGTEIAERLSDVAGKALPAILDSVSNLISVVLIVTLAPVVAFYLLLDWGRMIAHIDALLPRTHADAIRDLAREIDRTLSGFLRGQGLVTLILGSFYSVMLVAIGLPYGLVIGITAALLSIIPYVGVFLGGVIAIGVALFSFWDEPLWISAVVAIFAFGQAVEGNVLQPRIVGGHVGLHPVWLMLALAVFGSLFGFVGLVVAVPLAAVLGVLARAGAARYRESGLYTGRIVPPEPAAAMLVELVPRGTTARKRVSASVARNDAMARIRAEDEARDEAAETGEAPDLQEAVQVVADAVVEAGEMARAASPPADRPPADRPPADRPPADRPPADRPPGDKPR